MVKILYSFRLKSHPDKLLSTHLDEVYSVGIELFKEKSIFLEESEFLKTLLIAHDLGKGTKYFQSYISGRENHGTLKNHGFLSALISYVILYKKVDMDKALKGFILVKRHHGNIANIVDEISIKQIDLEYHENILKKQLEGLDIEEINNILNKYSEPIVKKEEILNSFQYLFSDMEGRFFYEDEMNMDIDEYFKLKYFYSILIYSDKFSAILSKKTNINYPLDSKSFSNYMNSLGKGGNEININRKKAQKEVQNRLNSDEKLLTITLPTGMGKTLNSLNFALKLREDLFIRTNIYYNIIYSFPFTSIIDQTYEIFESIFDNNTSNLMKHHYLAKVEYKDEENVFDVDESQFLIETWNSNIVVTTFVKVLETIFSNRNRELMKFHKMARSIIILDEVQNIPYKYWKIIKESLRVLSEKFNTYFLLMTATQPYIIGESYELVENVDKYFTLFNRTRLILDLEEIDINGFIEKIIPIINDNKKSMIVLNTVKSAQKVYKELKDIVDKKIIFLSASVIPKDRKTRIEYIKKSNEYILVSTQVVEAGVDIDNDVVIRDLGPWDSIVQCAGRCNRNGKNEKAPVYIYKLKDDKFVFANLIYGRFLIDKTEEILRDKDEIEEKDYFKYSRKYFSLIEKDKSDDASNQILEDIDSLNFEYVNDQFNIIEKRNVNIIPVFIEKDKEARGLWHKYEENRQIKNKFERQKEFLKIKDRFLSYVVNVDIKKIPFELDKFYGKIPYENIDMHYDEELGYKIDDNETLFF